MEYPKWVDSAVEIKNFETYHNFDTEIQTSNSSYGVLVKPMELPKGKAVSKLTSQDLCIENGLVLPKNQEEICFYVSADKDNKVHSLACLPITKVPGLYFVDDITADKNDIFGTEENRSYFASIDGRMLADYLRIPKEEIAVLQQSYVNRSGMVLEKRNINDELQIQNISANDKVRILDTEVSLIKYRDREAVFALGTKLPELDKYEAVAMVTVPVKNLKEVRKIKSVLLDMIENNSALRIQLVKMQKANAVLRESTKSLSENLTLHSVRNGVDLLSADMEANRIQSENVNFFVRPEAIKPAIENGEKGYSLQGKDEFGKFNVFIPKDGGNVTASIVEKSKSFSGWLFVRTTVRAGFKKQYENMFLNIGGEDLKKVANETNKKIESKQMKLNGIENNYEK